MKGLRMAEVVWVVEKVVVLDGVVLTTSCWRGVALRMPAEWILWVPPNTKTARASTIMALKEMTNNLSLGISGCWNRVPRITAIGVVIRNVMDGSGWDGMGN